MKLLMITGLGSAKDLTSGNKGAFYNTLEVFSTHWDRIDIMAPRLKNQKTGIKILFGNVFIHTSPWPLVFHPFWFLKKGFEIYKEQKFDLMTVQEFPPFYNGIGARLLWQQIKVPYVLEIHHVPGHPKSANIREAIYSFMMRLFIKIDSSKAEAVRVVNKKQTPEFLIRAGVPKDKIKYIPSMYIDFSIFKKDPSVQKEYDLIFVGRMEGNKGINLFLEVVRKLNCGAVMVGNGTLFSETEKKIDSLKLNIELKGRVGGSREVAELMNKSRILVTPSYNEGGPRVVLEAMACGVPVLATNVGLIPDFAEKNAVKIIDWNADDIAQKAKELLENKSEQERLSGAGIVIANQFEKTKMIENYANKLKEIAK